MDVSCPWFRSHLTEELLPLWIGRAATRSGLFRCRFDNAWNPDKDGSGTLVSQSRLIYSFSVGHRLTGQERYLEAVRAGASSLLEKFKDPEHGGLFLSVNPRGKVLDDNKDSYGHAFAIFGLAHATLCTTEQRFAATALELWELLRTRFSDGRGGIWRKMSREFLPQDQQKSQNPIMHLFEALLALGSVPGFEAHLSDAEEVARFVLQRLSHKTDGRLPELFDQDWHALPAERRGYIDIGHQFEWAFLLSRAVELGMSHEFLGHAHRLLTAGMQLGFDAEEGGAFNAATPDGSLLKRRKGWWQQCELIRALMHHLVVRDRDDLREPLQKSLVFFRSRFHDDATGGWFPNADGSGNKGGPFKVDYHVVAMCDEAIRLAGMLS